MTSPLAHLDADELRVVRSVGAVFNMNPKAIVGPVRLRHIYAARLATIILLRESGRSTPAIGRALKRHHTSVLHALKGDSPAARLPDFAEKLQRARACRDAWLGDEEARV